MCVCVYKKKKEEKEQVEHVIKRKKDKKQKNKKQNKKIWQTRESCGILESSGKGGKKKKKRCRSTRVVGCCLKEGHKCKSMAEASFFRN